MLDDAIIFILHFLPFQELFSFHVYDLFSRRTAKSPFEMTIFQLQPLLK